MILIENRYVSQLVTPNHRILLKYVYNMDRKLKRVESDWHYVPAADIRPHSGLRLPVAGIIQNENPADFSLDLLRSVGWTITEGSYGRYGEVLIYQSVTKNPDKVASIGACLNSAGLEFSRYDQRKTYKGGPYLLATFRLPRPQASRIKNIVPDKTLTIPLVTALSFDQCTALYDSLVDGDGHRMADGRVSWSQKDPSELDAFRVLCLMLGKRTFQSAKGREVYVTNRSDCQIHQSDFAECVSSIGYRGRVWCPTLPNSNFVAKRNGRIFITGNTFPLGICWNPILSSCPPDGGIVLDPFAGSATVAEAVELSNILGAAVKDREMVAKTRQECAKGQKPLVAQARRKWIMLEISPKYCEIAERRLKPYR